MSRYALPADLAQQGLSANALSGIDPSIQQAALDSASSLADGYLRRFVLPLVAPFPQDLVRAVCAIAALDLMTSQSNFNPELGSDQMFIKRSDDAMKWLRDVSNGVVTPVVTDSSSASPVPAAPRVFSRCKRGW